MTPRSVSGPTTPEAFRGAIAEFALQLAGRPLDAAPAFTPPAEAAQP